MGEEEGEEVNEKEEVREEVSEAGWVECWSLQSLQNPRRSSLAFREDEPTQRLLPRLPELEPGGHSPLPPCSPSPSCCAPRRSSSCWAPTGPSPRSVRAPTPPSPRSGTPPLRTDIDLLHNRLIFYAFYLKGGAERLVPAALCLLVPLQLRLASTSSGIYLSVNYFLSSFGSSRSTLLARSILNPLAPALAPPALPLLHFAPIASI